jgi:hypothetical protein
MKRATISKTIERDEYIQGIYLVAVIALWSHSDLYSNIGTRPEAQYGLPKDSINKPLHISIHYHYARKTCYHIQRLSSIYIPIWAKNII